MLKKHHGSCSTRAHEAEIIKNMASKFYQCGCGWTVYALCEARKSNERGSCGKSWCTFGAAQNNTAVPVSSPKTLPQKPNPSSLKTSHVRPASKTQYDTSDDWSVGCDAWAWGDQHDRTVWFAGYDNNEVPNGDDDYVHSVSSKTESVGSNSGANMTASWKADEDACLVTLAVLKNHECEWADRAWRDTQEKLKSVRSERRMAKPVLIRLKALPNTEVACQRKRDEAEAELAEAKNAVVDARELHRKAQAKFASTDDELTDATAQVAQPRLENIDHDASNVAGEAAELLKGLEGIAAKCSGDELGDQVHRAIELASVVSIAADPRDANGGSSGEPAMANADGRSSDGRVTPKAVAVATPKRPSPSPFSRKPGAPPETSVRPAQLPVLGSGVASAIPMLPDGWATQVDPISGNVWYINTITNFVQAEVPRVPATSANISFIIRPQAISRPRLPSRLTSTMKMGLSLTERLRNVPSYYKKGVMLSRRRLIGRKLKQLSASVPGRLNAMPREQCG